MKWLLTFLLLVAASPAWAQNPTCPTRPPGDNSNACASTAFVQQHGGGGSGGTVPTGGTGVTSFTPNLPILGNGTSPLIQGTRSGNTTVFGTTSGSLTNGDCVSIDSDGNLVDAGGACTTGGGGGTVSAGTAGQLAYYPSNGTTVAGTTTGAGVLTAAALSVNTNGGLATFPTGAGTSVTNFGAFSSTTTGTGTISGSSTSLAILAAGDWADGQGILVPGAGPTSTIAAPGSVTASACTPPSPGGCSTGSTHYTLAIAAIDVNHGVGPVTSITATNGNATLNQKNYIQINWADVTDSQGYLIYVGGTPRVIVSEGSLSWRFAGNTIDPVLPSDYWVPSSPPGSGTKGDLVTTIASGGGTTTLTLTDAATNTATGVTIYHDNTPNFQAALDATGIVSIPCGTYEMDSYSVFLATGNALSGQSVSCTNINILSNGDSDKFHNDGTDISISNINVTNNFTNSTLGAILNDVGGNNIIYENIHISSFDYFGITLNATTEFRITNVQIDRAAISQRQNEAINLCCSTEHGFMENIRANNSGFDLDGAEIVVNNNLINNWGFGGGITTEQDPITSKTYNISGNTIIGGPSQTDINDTLGAGIEQWGQYTIISNNIIANTFGDGIDSGGQNSMVATNNLLPNVGQTSGKAIVRRCDNAAVNDTGTIYGPNQTNGVATVTIGTHC